METEQTFAIGRDLLRVEQISKSYGTGNRATKAIKSVSLSVERGQFCTVVGPSGCGKTTLLKCTAGLMRPSSGSAYLEGREVTAPPKDMAVVFQDYERSLMPWLSVRDNVALPLTPRVEKSERVRRTEEALAHVGLSKFASHYPRQLSGGMQQRVAIARALAYRPAILLMDEPMASVDAQTRAELEDLILRIRAEANLTVLLVTHDIDEAVYMSDRVVILSRPPSTVTHVVNVELSRPRDQIETKRLPEFADLRAFVYRQIVTGGELTGADTEEVGRWAIKS